MTPTSNKNTENIDKNVASILFTPHDSNFFASGSKINAISIATLNGISIGFAKTKIAKSANAVAIA